MQGQSILFGCLRGLAKVFPIPAFLDDAIRLLCYNEPSL